MNGIKINHLTKVFGGVRAVDDLTISIAHGKATGLIGPNGSGKTTLMNLITGLLKPDCGTIEIGNDTFDSINPQTLRDLRIARTFQDGRLVDQLSVDDNLLLAIAENETGKSLLQINTNSMQERLDKTLKKIGLTAHRKKMAEELSYGQRKLLELGRALIQDADIYLLDEPFSGLFAKQIDNVLNLITGLKESKKTIVIIEHNMGLIKQIADRLIVLDHGQLLASGSPNVVLKNKSVQQAYLGV
ncbi:MAG: ABC transporter ATP-binding protein [Alphaproteobacteria bacterium]|nr:ABC transporter ATP-binding protein [Alphaproteobacteria bacterium]